MPIGTSDKQIGFNVIDSLLQKARHILSPASRGVSFSSNPMMLQECHEFVTELTINGRPAENGNLNSARPTEERQSPPNSAEGLMIVIPANNNLFSRQAPCVRRANEDCSVTVEERALNQTHGGLIEDKVRRLSENNEISETCQVAKSL